MAKAMSIFGMVIAAAMLLVFGLDAAIGVPFGQANLVIDLGFAVAGAILGYMSFDAFRSAS